MTAGRVGCSSCVLCHSGRKPTPGRHLAAKECIGLYPDVGVESRPHQPSADGMPVKRGIPPHETFRSTTQAAVTSHASRLPCKDGWDQRNYGSRPKISSRSGDTTAVSPRRIASHADAHSRVRSIPW